MFSIYAGNALSLCLVEGAVASFSTPVGYVLYIVLMFVSFSNRQALLDV